MITLITILHIFLCIILIIIVLLQTGKGAEIGAAFGGASQTIFGPRGATTFLNKLTTASAIMFMITTMILAYFSGRSERLGGSIMDKDAVQRMEEKIDRETGAGKGPAEDVEASIEEKGLTEIEGSQGESSGEGSASDKQE